MEFACRFSYVPTLTNQRSAQKSNQNAIKRSALLPPKHKINCLQTPSPTRSIPSKIPQRSSAEQKDRGHIVKKQDPKRTWSETPTYEEVTFEHAEKTHVPVRQIPVISLPLQPSPARTRKALLPPPMKCQLGSHSPPSPIRRQDPSHSQVHRFVFDPSNEEEGREVPPFDTHNFHNIKEGSRVELNHPVNVVKTPSPPLSPQPSSVKTRPEFLSLAATASPSHRSSLFPSSSSTTAPVASSPAHADPPLVPMDKQPLPGNPNVVLVGLGRLITEENVCTIQCEPISCIQCGSAMESLYDNVVDTCYFCQSWENVSSTSLQPQCTPLGCLDCLFHLPSQSKTMYPDESLLIFCLDISAAMNINSQVSDDRQPIYKSRLQCVQQAVLECVQRLNEREPHTRVGLITFNNMVTLHGHGEFSSRSVWGAELIDVDHLKAVASSFPSPPPLLEGKEGLEKEIHRLLGSGSSALGPAALVAVAIASRQPGSKVLICTAGKANTGLGNLEVEDTDYPLLVPSSIFYQNLGEYAANQGVMLSVLSLEGTDCRLNELGKVADLTAGEIVIASPDGLYTAFQPLLENKIVATHCTVTLLLPSALTVQGEKEVGHKGIREVGNVVSDTEITLRFGAKKQHTEALISVGRVHVQLQVRYRQRNGQAVLRILSLDQRVTSDSSLVLPFLSLSILQLNSSQSSAALAVRGRYKDAVLEAEEQRKLLKRALDYINTPDKQQCIEGMKIMDLIYKNLNNYKRTGPVSTSTIQSLTDRAAVLLYGMKKGNRTSLSLQSSTGGMY